MVSKNTKLEKEITFLIKVMNGGGAERVITILSNALVEKGYTINLILTHQKLQDAKLSDVHKNIEVYSLEDMAKETQNKAMMFYARMLGKLTRLLKHKESEKGLVYKYYARNYGKIRWLKDFFKSRGTSTVIAFLYDSIFLTMGALTEENRVIISERGDPQQSERSKTTMAFLHTVFPTADQVVFQSPDVQKWYLEHMRVEGTVIFNPVRSDLPKPFEGERKKRIVNFCRISDQKNLELLVRAYARLHREYPEYELYIYGNAVGNGAEGYLDKVKGEIKTNGIEDVVHMLDGRSDIHDIIRDYAMFVSSSDFEGMSNSMLEALAIGLPCVCTDCPAGGARAIILDHENGLLVPVSEEESLYLAMKEIIEKPKLAEKLSENGRKIRDELSVDKVIEKWMEIING